MFARLIRALWGDFTEEELTKFLYLSLAAFFVIGAQWPLKLLKDSLLVGEMGPKLQPLMKTGSIFICLPFTIIYGWLVNYFRRENVLYILVSFLIVLGMGFYALLTLPLAPSLRFYVIASLYIYGDLFTVLSLPTFWAFVNDLTSPAEAKRGYGIIVFASQFGGLVLTFIGRMFAANTTLILSMSTFTLAIYGLCIWLVVHKVKRSNLVGYNAEAKKIEEKHKVKIPFMQGLALLVTSPYVAGICFLTAAQEISLTWMDYNMKVAMDAAFRHLPTLERVAHITAFTFDYGMVIQIISTIFSLVGTAYFQRRFGVRFCVISYPVLLLFCLIIAKLHPTLIVMATLMALAKGLHYALNKPVREILYIPTTKEVKYKSKAWIEVFGTRIFKCTGSFINMLPSFASNSISLIIPCAWVIVARIVGQKYHDSVKKNETVV